MNESVVAPSQSASSKRRKAVQSGPVNEEAGVFGSSTVASVVTRENVVYEEIEAFLGQMGTQTERVLDAAYAREEAHGDAVVASEEAALRAMRERGGGSTSTLIRMLGAWADGPAAAAAAAGGGGRAQASLDPVVVVGQFVDVTEDSAPVTRGSMSRTRRRATELSRNGCIHPDVLHQMALKSRFRMTEAMLKGRALSLQRVSYYYTKYSPRRKTVLRGALVGTAVVVAYFTVPAAALTAVASGVSAVTEAAGGGVAIFQLVLQVAIPVSTNISHLGYSRGLRAATPEILQTLFVGNPIVIGQCTAVAAGLMGTGLVGAVSGRVAVSLAGDAVFSLSRWTISFAFPDILTAHAEIAASQEARRRDEEARALRAWCLSGKRYEAYFKRGFRARATQPSRWLSRETVTKGAIDLLSNGGIYALGGCMWLGLLEMAKRLQHWASDAALDLARQIADEAKTTRFIHDQLRKLGRRYTARAIRWLLAASLEGHLISGERIGKGLQATADYEIRPGFSLRTIYRALGIEWLVNVQLGAIPGLRESTLAGVSLNYVAHKVFATGKVVSMSMLSERLSDHAAWVMDNLTQDNAVHTATEVAVVARRLVQRMSTVSTTEGADGGDAPVLPTFEEFSQRFFPYLRAATLHTGDVVRRGQTTYTVAEDTSDNLASTVILTQTSTETGEPLDNPITLHINLLDDPDAGAGFRIVRQSGDPADRPGAVYTAPVAVTAMLAADLRILAAEQQRHSLDDLIAQHMAAGHDEAELVAHALPALSGMRAIERYKTLLRGTPHAFAGTFAQFRNDAGIMRILGATHLQGAAAEKDLGPEWRDALEHLAQVAPDPATRAALPATYFPPGSASSLFARLRGDDLALLEDETRVEALLAGQGDAASDADFDRINAKMRDEVQRLEALGALKGFPDTGTALRAYFATAHLAGDSAGGKDAARSYAALSLWVSMKAERAERANLKETEAALAQGIDDLSGRLRAVAAGEATTLGRAQPLVLLPTPTGGVGPSRALSAAGLDDFRRSATSGAGGGGADEADKAMKHETAAARDANVADAMANAHADLRMVEAMQAGLEVQIQAAEKLGMSVSETERQALGELFASYASNILGTLSGLGSGGRNAVDEAAARARAILEEAAKRKQPASMGCVAPHGWNMGTMSPNVASEDSCYMPALAETVAHADVFEKATDLTAGLSGAAGTFLAGLSFVTGMSSAPGVVIGGAGTAIVAAKAAFKFSLANSISEDPNSVYMRIRTMSARDPATLEDHEKELYLGALAIQAAVGAALISDLPEEGSPPNAPAPMGSIEREYFPEHKRVSARYTNTDFLAALPAQALITEQMAGIIELLETGDIATIIDSKEAMTTLTEQAPDLLATVLLGGRTSSVAGKYYFSMRKQMAAMELGNDFSTVRRGVDAWGDLIGKESNVFTHTALFTLPITLYDATYASVTFVATNMVGIAVATKDIVSSSATLVAEYASSATAAVAGMWSSMTSWWAPDERTPDNAG